VNGQVLDILPEEVEVRLQAKEGYAVASEGAYLAALVTELTPELVSEGLAREFVRRVQDLRKTADFDIADRIHLSYQATPGLEKAVREFQDYIMAETLSISVTNEVPAEDVVRFDDDFDGEKVSLGLRKA
jgi:isoleucyl-tRNA synthetase